LRDPLLGNVHPGNDLDAGSHLFLDCQGRIGNLPQLAVDAIADAVKLFIRLEVDVGSAIVDRIQQYFLNELDDRCVIHIQGNGFIGLGLIFFFRKFEVQVLIGEILEVFFCRFRIFDDQRCQFGLFDNDGVHCQACLEANFVQGPQICWVSYRYREPVAALVQRYDAVGGDELPVNGAGRNVGFIESAQIKDRVAERFSCEYGYFPGAGPLAGDHLLNECRALFAGLGHEGFGFGLFEASSLDHGARKTT